MYFWIIPLVIGIILLTVFLIFRVQEKRVIAVIIKGFTSLCFIITALVAWQTSKIPNNGFGIFILIALFFGLLGDVLLDIKYISKEHSLLFTRLGFVAFGVGHIFFATGLFIQFYQHEMNPLYIIVPAVIATILAVFTLLMEKFSPIKYGNMKPFVPTYGILLFFTTCIYISFTIFYGWQNITLILMSVGFILFTLSDLILNNTYFSSGFDKPIHIILNHTLYYVAQFLIALSLFFLL